MIIGQTNRLPERAAPPPGHPHALWERLGSATELAGPAVARYGVDLRRVRSLPALRDFLESYRAERLLPVELPAIAQAHAHALRNELRELVALDARLGKDARAREFAAASCRVGQRQLNRLRPLRDQRLVQRYRAAIEDGRAHGWHTLVYGVSLGIFSLPLRQGLLAYAWHTLGGFIEKAGCPLALTVGQCCELQAQLCQPIPEAVQQLLLETGATSLRVV